ncbi:hypothetical protein PM022_00395 [Halorubrum ezzemoulense]|nr:hypothetical protein [Halorubrum ezzemoulense]
MSPPVALGWALREFEVLGSDTPAEGLTPEVLEQQVYQTARTRKSTNASTIVDNRNILDGVENTAYTDAKIAAIEELNAGSSESEVLDAAQTAANSYLATVESNLLKTWNESVNELEKLVNTVRSHSELSLESITGFSDGHSITVAYNSVDRTLYDGSSLTVREIDIDTSANSTSGTTASVISPLDPRRGDSSVDAGYSFPWTTSSGDVDYLSTEPSGDGGDWYEIYNTLSTLQSDLIDSISTWVSSVYSDVQSGEIEITELITPRERAAMLSDDESEAQAIADLAALNIPIDSEREVTITIAETGATLSGTIGLTDKSDGPIESGTTYDPSTFTGDVYLTADVSQLSGTWDAYETGVDGGTITLTAQPYEGTVLNVTTTAGETVSVPAADWTDNGDGTYSYDASGDLETNITEVESVAYVSGADETQYETLNLSKQFTVDSIVNQQTGEQTSSASFESSEPQDDSNYITQEEWDQLEQQNQELIEKYEESQSSGGAGTGWFEGSSPDIGLIAGVVGVAGVAYALFGQGGNN